MTAFEAPESLLGGKKTERHILFQKGGRLSRERVSKCPSVPITLNRLYRNVTLQEEKELLQQNLPRILRETLENRRQKALEELEKSIWKATEEARANGLTPEILESLLNDDE